MPSFNILTEFHGSRLFLSSFLTLYINPLFHPSSYLPPPQGEKKRIRLGKKEAKKILKNLAVIKVKRDKSHKRRRQNHQKSLYSSILLSLLLRSSLPKFSYFHFIFLYLSFYLAGSPIKSFYVIKKMYLICFSFQALARSFYLFSLVYPCLLATYLARWFQSPPPNPPPPYNKFYCKIGETFHWS